MEEEDDDLIECCSCGKTTERYSRILHDHDWARTDYFGIYTGMYCDECYDSDAYSYRKNNYSKDARACGECIDEE